MALSRLSSLYILLLHLTATVLKWLPLAWMEALFPAGVSPCQAIQQHFHLLGSAAFFSARHCLGMRPQGASNWLSVSLCRCGVACRIPCQHVKASKSACLLNMLLVCALTKGSCSTRAASHSISTSWKGTESQTRKPLHLTHFPLRA